MPTLTDRLRTFMRSPQGRRLARRAQDELSKPDNRRRVRQLLTRLRRRG